MATAKNKLATLDNTSNTGVPALKSMLATQAIKKQIKSLLGERAGHFMMAIVQVVEGTPQLQQADPQSIINAAIASAVLNLPIEKNLGFAYIVPYNDRERGMIAQFQMGYKGYIQLALEVENISSSMQYKSKRGSYKGITFLQENFNLNL